MSRTAYVRNKSEIHGVVVMLLEINVSDELGDKILNYVHDAARKVSAYETELSYQDIYNALCGLALTQGIEALERNALLR